MTITAFESGCRMWGLDWCLAEGNIVELNLRTVNPAIYDQPIGISIYGGGSLPQDRLRQFVVRDNVVRNIDNLPDPINNGDTKAYALWLNSWDALTENALLQNNVVRLDRDDISGNVGSLPLF